MFDYYIGHIQDEKLRNVSLKPIVEINNFLFETDKEYIHMDYLHGVIPKDSDIGIKIKELIIQKNNATDINELIAHEIIKYWAIYDISIIFTLIERQYDEGYKQGKKDKSRDVAFTMNRLLNP